MAVCLSFIREVDVEFDNSVRQHIAVNKIFFCAKFFYGALHLVTANA